MASLELAEPPGRHAWVGSVGQRRRPYSESLHLPAMARRKMGAALPPGSAGIVAIYDREKTDTVNTTLASAVRKSVALVDGGGAKALKAGLAEAQAGMAG